jgi:hypothetical protein
MSVVALKKKSHAIQFAQVSSKDTFNLYGTMRKHVYTQPNIMKSRKGTPFTRNNGPQSHGGSTSSSQVINNADCFCEPKSLSSSVKNTFASHSLRFQYTKRPYPNGTFKLAGQGSMMENYNQSSYVESKKSNCNDAEDLRYQNTNRQTQIQKYALCPKVHSQKISSNSGPCSS